MANAPQLTVGLGFDLDEASAKKVVKGMEQLNNHLEGSAETASKKVGNTWASGLGNMVKGFLAFEVATRGFQFTKDLFLLEEKFRSMQLPLKNLTEGTGDFGRSLSFITELADRTGQDLFVLGDGYKGIYASAKQAGIATEEVNKIFSSVVRAGSSLKLSNDQVSLSLKAIEQMMNKGVISSEELRQQLGDHLPGAYALMAKAAQDAGISTSGTTQELAKLLEEGKVGSAQVLPFFAKRMEEAFGKNAEANINTISGSANRLNNELTHLIDALDNGKVISFWATFQNSMADVFKDLTYYINSGSWKEFISHFGVNGGLKAQRVKMEGEKSFSLKSKPEQSTELKSLVNDLRYSHIALGRTLEDGTKIDQEYRKGLIDKIATYTKIFKSTKDVAEKITIPPLTPKDSDKAVKAIQDYTFEISLLDAETEKSLSNIQHLWEDIFRTQDAVFSGMDIKKISNIFAARGEQESLGEQLRKSFDITPLGDELEKSTNNLINRLNVIKDKIKPSISEFTTDLGKFISKNYDVLKSVLSVSIGGMADMMATGLANMFNQDVEFDPKKMIAQVLQSVGEMLIGIAVPLVAALALGNVATLGGMSVQWGAALGMLGAGIAMKGGGMALSGGNAPSPSESPSYKNSFNSSGNFNRQSAIPQTVEVRFANGALKGYIDNRDKKYNG